MRQNFVESTCITSEQSGCSTRHAKMLKIENCGSWNGTMPEKNWAQIVLRLIKIQEQKEIFDLCCKKIKEELCGITHLLDSIFICLNHFNFSLFALPLVQIFWGLGLLILIPDADFHLIQSCFWPWLLVPYFPGGRRSDITIHFEAPRIVVFLIFLWFLSRLLLGGMAHFLWLPFLWRPV